MLNKQQISLTVGSAILGSVATIAILVLQPYLVQQDIGITATFMLHRPKNKGVPEAVKSEVCVVGQVCAGPTVAANDPEGDKVTYKFLDEQRKPVAESITADSGAPVTPEFKFNEAGEKKIYMVVEDGSGHTSADYPIIIPVEPKQ